MQVRQFLPKTRQPFLLAAILLLVAGLVVEGAVDLQRFLSIQSWDSLPIAVLCFALAVGLWILHPIARWAAVFLLWLVLVVDLVMLFGIFNPFMAMELRHSEGQAPSVAELAARVWPWIAAIPAVLLILHILGKHKTEFRR